MKKHIPLILEHITNSDINYYVRLRFYREFIDYQNCTIMKNHPYVLTTYFNSQRLKGLTQMQAGELIGVNRITWAKHTKELIAAPVWTIREDIQFNLMPFAVFDAFLEWLDGVAATVHAKEALLKCYCYMYFNAARFKGQFQNSQTNIAIELGTTAKLVGQRLKLLRENGWLRRFGTYKFGGEMNWCYKYAIPEEHQAKDIF